MDSPHAAAQIILIAEAGETEWGSACNVNWRDAIWSRAYLPAAVRGGYGARWVALRLVAQRMEPCVLGAAEPRHLPADGRTGT